MTKVSSRLQVVVLGCVFVASLVMSGCVSQDEFKKVTSGLTTDVKAIDGRVSSLDDSVKANKTAIDGVAGNMDGLTKQMDAITSKMGELEKLLSLEQRLATVEATLLQQNTKQNTLAAASANAERRLNGLDQSMALAATKESVDRLDTDMKSRVATLAAKDDQLEKDLREKAVDLDGKIGKNAKTIEVAVADLKTLKFFSSKIDSEMKDLEARVRKTLRDHAALLSIQRQKLASVLQAELDTLQERRRVLQKAVELLQAAVGGAPAPKPAPAQIPSE